MGIISNWLQKQEQQRIDQDCDNVVKLGYHVRRLLPCAVTGTPPTRDQVCDSLSKIVKLCKNTPETTIHLTFGEIEFKRGKFINHEYDPLNPFGED